MIYFKIMIRSSHLFIRSNFFSKASRGMAGLLNSDSTRRLKSKIAVCQITSTSEPEVNYMVVKDLIEKARKNDAEMVFFPEASDYITPRKAESLENASHLESSFVNRFRVLARENKIWISLGSIHEKISDKKFYNSHLIIDNLGNVIVYRKLHLYDVDYPEQNIKMQESEIAQQGDAIIPPVDTPVGKVGMAICYDLRFPELSLALTRMGAEILTFPSAFMPTTGKAHWEPLLRARAIETQCYVVAAAQSGKHNEQRSSWGHAMVVDPWGTIIAKCDDGDDISYAEIDLSFLTNVRKTMPLRDQRRNDVYPSLIPHSSKSSNQELCNDNSTYQFGQSSVHANFIFYRTVLTMAFTNKRCVVPGHVLVSPIRCVERMSDLTPDEVCNLFLVVQKVQRVMETAHSATASTICVQDGKDAGQTIKHVHVHILPRRAGDFPENDQIYTELQKHDKEPTNSGARIRTDAEMAEEAVKLREYFA